MANKTGKEWSSLLVKGKGGSFQGAIQEYNTVNGIVAVAFCTDTAYVFKDSQGLFDSKEMQHQIKTAGHGFPYANDDVYEEITDGEVVTEKLVAELGLTDTDVTDIKERLESLACFGEEKDFKM